MTTTTRPMIEFRGVTKRFGSHEVLRDVSNQVAQREKVVVIGPSGSGKSTLLRTVNRLETIEAGEVIVDGISVHDRKTDINALRTRVGMVQQSFNLFPQLTVLDNITLAPRKVKHETREVAEQRARALLERVGIPEKAEAYPAQLSGGQQQRVAIARALAMEPSVMLFDEPTSALDPEMIQEVLDVKIAKALGLREDQIEFVEAVSANRIPYLQEDKADLVIATMTINAARKEQIEFSRPYYLAGQSILVKNENNTIKTVEDLNGKKVCSVQGSTSKNNVKAKAPSADLTSFTTYSACVSAMKDGRVEAVSTDDIILAGFASTDKSLKLVGGTFTTEPYGIGMKKGKTDLQRFVDGVLNQMLQDGRWERLYTQFPGSAPGVLPAAEAKAKLPASA